MRVDREHQLFHRGFEFHGGNGLGDELCGLRSDDVDAENFTMLSVGDDFHEAVVLAHD